MDKKIFIYYLGSDYLPNLDYQTPTGFDGLEDKYINTLETRNKAILEHQKSERYTLFDFIQAFNSEEISDLGWIAFKEEESSSSEVIINIVEISSKLAHNAARDEMMSETSKGNFKINHEEEMWIDDGVIDVYTEEAQEVFNRHYDYYYEMIEKFKKL